MTDRSRLIDTLVADLAPVPWWRRPQVLVGLWTVFSVAFVVTLSALIDPWRTGFGRQLAGTPVFALEILVATGGFTALAVLGFRTAIPAAVLPSRGLVLGSLALLPWLLLLAWGLREPALDPSMAGKRAACNLEVVVLSAPLLALGLRICRGLFPVHGWATGALLGAAAGSIPGVAMQMACMYIVPHALTHHVLPILVPTLAGAAAGAWLLRRD